MIPIILRSTRPHSTPAPARTVDGSRGAILTALDVFIREIENDWPKLTEAYGPYIRTEHLADYYGVTARRARYVAWVMGMTGKREWRWSRVDQNKVLVERGMR